MRQFEPADLLGQVVAGYTLETFLGPTETGPVFQARRHASEGQRAQRAGTDAQQPPSTRAWPWRTRVPFLPGHRSSGSHR